MDSLVEPTLNDILATLKEDIFSNLNCLKIGIIKGFDASDQTATVQLVDKRIMPYPVIVNGKENERQTFIDLPPLIKCPVFIMKGINGGITLPITIGDNCGVIFNDRDIDKWMADGNVQPPGSFRMHNLSDGIVLPGLHSNANSIDNYNNNATEFFYKNTKISLSESNIESLSDTYKVLATKSISLKTDAGGEINIDKQIEIKNMIGTLGTLMQEFLTIIQTMNNALAIAQTTTVPAQTNGPLTSATILSGLIPTITQLISKFKALLK